MYYMDQVPSFAPTLFELVERRYSMIQCYLNKELRVKDILEKFNITSPDFYKYLHRFHSYGKTGLQNIKRGAKVPHNKINPQLEEEIISLHKKHPYFSSYEINQLLKIVPKTILRVRKRNNLQKSYLPKSQKKTILERLKKELDQKRKQKK